MKIVLTVYDEKFSQAISLPMFIFFIKVINKLRKASTIVLVVEKLCGSSKHFFSRGRKVCLEISFRNST